VRHYRRPVAVIVVLVLLAVLAIPTAIAVRILLESGVNDERPSDVILVMGAAQYDGTPGPVLTARARHAAALHRRGVAPEVATVGGRRPGDRFTEAAAAATWLAERGVPADLVTPIPRGRDTASSVRAFAALASAHRWQAVTIVTDPMHQYRSALLARDAGLQVRTSPAQAATGGLPAAYFLLRETVAVGEYFLSRLGRRMTGSDAAPGAAGR